MTTVASPSPKIAQTTALSLIVVVSMCHMFNDIMQSLLSAIYPLIKTNYDLDFWQIGLLTMTFQVTASLLQPLIGIVTDRWSMPYSLPVSSISTFTGLLLLANADSYTVLLIGASLIGLGSAIFHPEGSRVARTASGGRHGLAQSLFQVGGNFGSALGPLIGAFIILPNGQSSVAWMAVIAVFGFIALTGVSRWYAERQRQNKNNAPADRSLPLPHGRVLFAILILVLLTATKNVYMSSISSYFTFFVIEKFNISIQDAQLMLFLFLGASAVGVFLGGPIGDRMGTRFVIWFSILGVIPFTLMLPYANLFWTCTLSVIIGLIFSSAFSAIVVFAQELVPGRVGMIAGMFFGFAFGAGGIGAALLGIFADSHGIEYVYWLCSFLPLLGIMTILLPHIPQKY